MPLSLWPGAAERSAVQQRRLVRVGRGAAVRYNSGKPDGAAANLTERALVWVA